MKIGQHHSIGFAFVCVFVASFFTSASSSPTKNQLPRSPAPSHLDNAQKEFANQYIRRELKALQDNHYFWSYQIGFQDRFVRLKNRFSGFTFCRQALRDLFAVQNVGPVSWVCFEVKMTNPDNHWSKHFTEISAKDYPFPVKTGIDCSRDEIDEKTYRIRVAFSECSDGKCFARTYVKRIREWCGTGWETRNFVLNIQGVRFDVLDGLQEEVLGTADGFTSETIHTNKTGRIWVE